MKDHKALFLAQAAMIAAIYVVLLLLFAPVSFQNYQVRIAEGLTILPYFTPAAIPGLFVGCLIGNTLAGAIPLDILFGSLATLAGAFASYALRKYKFAVPIPPILANTIVVPLVLYYGYGINIPIPVQMLTVGIGEFLSCGVVGMVFLFILDKYKYRIPYFTTFRKD